MLDIKDLSNDELEKVAGGDNSNVVENTFNKGDWIQKDNGITRKGEVAYYIKDVFENDYHIIRYRYDHNPVFKDKPFAKFDLHNQSKSAYSYYHVIAKPSWVTEDPSL